MSKIRVLLITDPLPDGVSVQFRIVSALLERLSRRYSVDLFGPYVGPRRTRSLEEGGCAVLSPDGPGFLLPALRRLLRRETATESMLWLESWAREALFGASSAAVKGYLADYDRVLNISSTVVAKADLWWCQGIPLDLTVRGMQETNLLARLLGPLAAPVIRRMDSELLRSIRASAKHALTISPFTQEVLANRGIETDGVVFSFPDLETFQPTSERRSRDYVLLYSGKETSRLDWDQLRNAGVRLVAFGGKRVPGDGLGDGRAGIEWRGHVTDDELRDLYTNALFTLVPFSYEALGFVPLESMACGTPVLTYGRQGPSFTVVDGQTGWLCMTPREMENKVIELWSRRSTGISPDECLRRANEFLFEPQAARLLAWMGDGS